VESIICILSTLRLLAILYMFFEVLTSVCQFAPKLTPVSFPGSCNLLSLPQSIPQVIWLYSSIDGQSEFYLILTPKWNLISNWEFSQLLSTVKFMFALLNFFLVLLWETVLWNLFFIYRLTSFPQSYPDSPSSFTISTFVAPPTATIASTFVTRPTAATSSRLVSHLAAFKTTPSQLIYN
jgi:hypothetical protein